MNAMQAKATAGQCNGDEVRRAACKRHALATIELAAAFEEHECCVDMVPLHIDYVADELRNMGFKVQIHFGTRIVANWFEPNAEQYRCHKVAELSYLYGKNRSEAEHDELMRQKIRTIRENDERAVREANEIRDAVAAGKTVTVRYPERVRAVKDDTCVHPTFDYGYARRSASDADRKAIREAWEGKPSGEPIVLPTGEKVEFINVRPVFSHRNPPTMQVMNNPCAEIPLMACQSMDRVHRLTRIPLSSICFENRTLDVMLVSKLTQEIKERGVLKPIHVRPHGDLYKCLDGVEACRNCGIETIMCLVTEIQQADIVPADPAAFAQGLHNILKKNPTMTIAELGFKLGKDMSWLHGILNKYKDQEPHTVRSAGDVNAQPSFGLEEITAMRADLATLVDQDPINWPAIDALIMKIDKAVADHVPAMLSNESILPKEIVDRGYAQLKAMNARKEAFKDSIFNDPDGGNVVAIQEVGDCKPTHVGWVDSQDPGIGKSVTFKDGMGNMIEVPIQTAGAELTPRKDGKLPCKCSKRQVLDHGCGCGGY